MDLEDSPVVLASKDKGKEKVTPPEGFQEEDPPMSSHQGRGFYWGAMEFS